MQNTCEASSTGYVESIHKKLRVLEMKCGSSGTSESVQLVSDMDTGAQHEQRGNLPRVRPTTMQVQVQNNSLHLHKLTLQNAMSVQAIPTI